MANLIIEDTEVRIDDETAYVCITDIANLKRGGKENIKSWMRLFGSVEFFIAWERKHNSNFKEGDFAPFRNEAGSNTFHLSASELVEAGAIGIFVKRGRYGGTYCAPQWAIHFANWLDADFYLQTVDAYLYYSELNQGKYAQLQRFSRELAGENLKLVTQAAFKQLPESADGLFKRHIASVESDLLNLSMWGMTAQEWRIKFPDQFTNEKGNMREYATPEELKTLASLEVLSQEMQQTGYSSEERLDRLRIKAQELLEHYCSSDDKIAVLTLARHKRGWGDYNG
jgi:hypothetical protein